MANKAVAGYTQVPIAAQDILREEHLRSNATGTITQVTVQYQVRDTLDVVRAIRQITFQSGAYPTSGATLLANCNTAEGT